MPKELLFSVTQKDFKIDYFSGTGAGGQHRNKHQNCVRIRHNDSGVMVTGQSNRERQANLREAFRSMTKSPKFKLWLNQRIMETMTGKTIAQRVEEKMSPENLKVEMFEKGKWKPFKI